MRDESTQIVHCGTSKMFVTKYGRRATVVECMTGCGRQLDLCNGVDGGCRCHCHLLRASYRERELVLHR